jgi:CheY-like chemotaxis protein
VFAEVPVSIASALTPSPNDDRAARSVLVVDDRPCNRELMAEVLSGGGYRPLTAARGEDALELARQERPSVIVTDVLMPGISGTTLAQRALALRPNLKVVLTSGYMKNEPWSGLPLVPKPYRIQDLIATVENTLRV